MKKLKGFLLLVLSIVLVVGFSINVYATNFEDVASTHWAYESIQWGLVKELVVVYEDGTYRPKEQILESEFVTVLTRYTKIPVGSKLEGAHWSQNFYDAIKGYSLPLKGGSNDVSKNTALSRGQIARIIAAKNGFNFDERQAIYYMYENDISKGLISGKLSFDSYGKGDSVNREQIPAFFQRLEKAGVTTFKGKQSTIKPNQVGGINGVPKDDTVITDKDFEDLNKPSVKLGTLANPIKASVASGTITTSSAFRDLLKTHPELLNKMVGVVNGVVTPVDINITHGDMSGGWLLTTSLSSTKLENGFHDRKLFLEIVDKHWAGKIIDANQVKHIKDLADKHLDVMIPSTNMYLIKGALNDIVVSGSRYSVDINIYSKGKSGLD